MKDIVKAMSAEGSTDVELAMQRITRDDRQVAGWRALLASLAPFERELLTLVAQGCSPMAKDTVLALSKHAGFAPTIAKIRSAIERLKRAGIIAKQGAGFVVEDRLFADYIAGRGQPNTATRLR
jgi:uncharacterized protein